MEDTRQKSKMGKGEKIAYGASGVATLGLAHHAIHATDTHANMQKNKLEKVIRGKYSDNEIKVANHNMHNWIGDTLDKHKKSGEEHLNLSKKIVAKKKELSKGISELKEKGYHQDSHVLSSQKDTFDIAHIKSRQLDKSARLKKHGKYVGGAIAATAAVGAGLTYLRKRKEKKNTQ